MNEFERILSDAKEQYNKVIIINDDVSEKYKEDCKKKGIPIFNLSVKLAELLIDVPEEDRDQEAADKLREWFHQIDEDIIGFDNIDYLFSQEVGKINPINTFNYLTRRKKVIILFIRAKKRNNLLIYSEEGSPDYMELDISNNEGFVIGW
jgi:hypothetical protein